MSFLLRCKNHSLIPVNGTVYMFGKNNHIISTVAAASDIQWTPVRILPQHPVRNIACGTLHAVALTGTGDTEWRKADDLSDISDVEGADVRNDEEDDVGVEVDLPRAQPEVSRMMPSRERTTLSLADFYGPSPSPTFVNTGKKTKINKPQSQSRIHVR